MGGARRTNERGLQGTPPRTPRERKAVLRYSPPSPVPRGRAKQKSVRRLGESQDFLDRLANRVEPAGAPELIQEEQDEEASEEEDLDKEWLPEGAAAVVRSLTAAADHLEEGTGRRDASF